MSDQDDSGWVDPIVVGDGTGGVDDVKGGPDVEVGAGGGIDVGTAKAAQVGGEHDEAEFGEALDTSVLGVLQAAVDTSESTAVHRWVIGVDTDQYTTVVDLPGTVDAEAWRDHILTSVIKRVDHVIFDAMADNSNGVIDPGIQHRGLADNAVDISYSGGYLDDNRPQLESLRRRIINGTIDVPCRPPDRLGRSTPDRPHPCAP